MMESSKASSLRKRKVIRLITISFCGLAALVVLLCLSAYLLIHPYISKVNYVPLEEANAPLAEPLDELLADKSGEMGDLYDILGKASLWAKESVETSATGGEITGLGLPVKILADAEGVSEKELLDAEADGASGGLMAADRLKDSSRSNPGDGLPPILQDKEVLNLLLIGTDNRRPGAQGLSDSMIILSIHQKEERITAVSLLRDIYLHIPDKDTDNRLNTAYAYGGARLLIKTIEENFRIKIDKYASVDFFSFVDLLDTIGGIQLNITKEELPYVNYYIKELNILQGKEKEMDFLMLPGVQMLNGRQVLGYARVRYVGTDFARTGRQRKILEQIYIKTKKLNIREITDLLDLLLPQVTTNLTEKEIISQLLSIPDYMNYKFDSFYIPQSGTYENARIRGMQVLDIDFKANVKELQKRLYGIE